MRWLLTELEAHLVGTTAAEQLKQQGQNQMLDWVTLALAVDPADVPVIADEDDRRRLAANRECEPIQHRSKKGRVAERLLGKIRRSLSFAGAACRWMSFGAGLRKQRRRATRWQTGTICSGASRPCAGNVDVSEVWSPPRVTGATVRRGLTPGPAFDLLTGYNILSVKDRAKMWAEQASTLKEALADALSKEHALVFSCITAKALASLHAKGFVHQGLQPA